MTSITETKDFLGKPSEKETSQVKQLSSVHYPCPPRRESLPRIVKDRPYTIETNVQIEKVVVSHCEVKNEKDEFIKNPSEKILEISETEIAEKDVEKNDFNEKCTLEQESGVASNISLASIENSTTLIASPAVTVVNPSINYNYNVAYNAKVWQTKLTNETLPSESSHIESKKFARNDTLKGINRVFGKAEKSGMDDSKKSFKIFRINSLPVRLHFPSFKNFKTYVQEKPVATCEFKLLFL